MAQKISKTFSHIGENIKKIREAKRISQAEFAALFQLARPSVGAYEEGRSEPKIETVIQIANHFSISIDVLLTRKLTLAEIYSFDRLNKKLDAVHRTKKEVKGPGKECTLVRANQYYEYIVNHDKKDYISNLSKLVLPATSKVQQRVFEAHDSEMEYHQQGIHHGDMVVGQPMSMSGLEKSQNQILILVHQENIHIRRLSAIQGQHLELKADDPNHPILTIDRSEVLELWKAVAVYSTYLNPPSLWEERLLRVEEKLKNLPG
ncbi:MAG: helix-turn-helix transcriptional regulator [Bacteroidota bacterium]